MVNRETLQCRGCVWKSESSDEADILEQEVEMEHDGVRFSFLEKFYRCPECDGVVFSRELMRGNIDRANEAYQKAKNS